MWSCLWPSWECWLVLNGGFCLFWCLPSSWPLSCVSTSLGGLYEWQRQRVRLERRASYLDWLLTSDMHAKELRLHDLGTLLRDAYSKLRWQIRSEAAQDREGKDARRGWRCCRGRIPSLSGLSRGLSCARWPVIFHSVILFCSFCCSGVQNRADARPLLRSRDFTRTSFTFRNSSVSCRWSQNCALLRHHSPYLSLCPWDFASKNVSFRYPNSQRYALEDIDLFLPAGKLVALVGENGSGKTTLIKVMTRLYDPDEGRVTLDGIDIRSFDPIAYRKQFSVIFQDFAKYATTANENIWYGDAGTSQDVSRNRDAALRAGADEFLRVLPKGYDTPLSRNIRRWS